MMLFSIMLQYKYYHFCITCYDISYIKNSLISAPAAPPPKQVKLAEMAKARQTSITSFTRLGGGDETRPLKINHPQVCIWILESVSFSGNLAFIMQKMPLNQLFHALSILLSPMPYYFVFQAVGISRRILQMIALDNEPFGVVNRIGFTRLMAHLVPNYLIPSPHYFTELLPSEYDACLAALLALLEKALNISFTTDLWTTKNSTTSHMALTGGSLSH